MLVAVAVGSAWALASIGNVLLLIFVAVFNVAVLSPVVSVMERRLGWSRGLCATVLVVGTVIVLGVVVLVIAQAIGDGVRDFSRHLPQILDKVRHSDVGSVINGGSNVVETLRQHAGDITSGVGKVSAGVAHVGVSAFGAVTLVFSVIFLTLFGLIDEPRVGTWSGGLLSGKGGSGMGRSRIESSARPRVTCWATWPSLFICGTVYGVTAVILGVPYPLALAVLAGILDLIPNIGATIAGIIVGLVALSVSVGALIAFLIVIVVYQQIENYVLQPTIIGKAAKVSGFTVLASVLVFGALFGFIGASSADRGGAADCRRRDHRHEKGWYRRGGGRGAAATGVTAGSALSADRATHHASRSASAAVTASPG